MLAAALALDEVERVEGIREALGAVNAAWHVASATHKPDLLQQAERHIRRQFTLHRRVREPDAVEVEQVVATVQRAERIARRARRKGR